MTFPGDQGLGPRAPEWRTRLAAILLLFLVLCLCVLVLGARKQGGGLAGAILRGLAKLPLMGRLLQPLLESAPVIDAPSLELAAPPPAPRSASTPVPNQYLVRPTNWPAAWPWPPGSKDQPAVVPAAQATATPAAQPAAVPTVQPTVAPAAQPTAVPADEPTLSPEQEKELLGNPEEGPVG